MINAALPYSLIFFAYLLGSIPFGVLIAKAKGVNLQNAGSKNIGATNVLRTVSKGAALLTLAGDLLKGAAAVILITLVIKGELWKSIIGITVVLGHMYPVFLSFKGGKGVATGFGVLAVYSPLSALIMFVIWILTAFYTKYSSLAAITAFISLPLIFAFLEPSGVKISFALILAVLIILRHKTNIKRLIEGTETKIGDKTKV